LCEAVHAEATEGSPIIIITTIIIIIIIHLIFQRSTRVDIELVIR
jgi:hypothetical protein